MITITIKNTLNLSPLANNINPHIEVEEQHQHRSVKHSVEDPRANPVAPTFEEEVQQEHPNMAHHVATQQRDLAIEHKGEARAPKPNRGPEPVPVHQGVHQGGEEDGEDLKGLGELEPEEGHKGGDGVIEDLEKRQPATSQDGEECGEHVEEAGEVVEVGPEEDPAGGAGAQGEAEEPLEGGLGAAPEPPGVADLGGGGEECSGEDGGGAEGHGAAVEGGEGAEGEGEGEGEEEVEGYGGEEEGPRGTPRLGVAPTEPHDGGVLREVEGDQGVDRRRRWQWVAHGRRRLLWRRRRGVRWWLWRRGSHSVIHHFVQFSWNLGKEEKYVGF